MKLNNIANKGYQASSIVQTCIQALNSGNHRQPGWDSAIGSTLDHAGTLIGEMIDTAELGERSISGSDQHSIWLAEHQRTLARWIALAKMLDGGNFDTPEMLKLSERRHELENLIYKTEANTIDGALAKLQLIQLEADGDFLDSRHTGALASAVETLQNLMSTRN